MNACDYARQFNFIIAHIPGITNTAADYLSRSEHDTKNWPREYVETHPIEIIVKSASISEKEHVFFTEEVDRTEAEIWERQKQRRNYSSTETL